MKTQWAFCAGLTGLAAGIFLGLALAPQSGKETQALVKQKTLDGLDQLVGTGKKAVAHLQDLTDKGKELADRGKEQLTDAVEAGKQAYGRVAVGS